MMPQHWQESEAEFVERTTEFFVERRLSRWRRLRWWLADLVARISLKVAP